MIFVDNAETLMQCVIAIQKSDRIGLDVEGTGEEPYTSRLLLIQLYDAVNSYVLDISKLDKREMIYLLTLLQGKLICGHNIKYDLKFIYHFYGILLTDVFDTMLAEVLINAGVGQPFISLKTLVKKYTGIELKKEVRDEFIGKVDSEFTEEQLNYAATDVEVLFAIVDAQINNLKKVGQDKVWELERKLIPAVVAMEYIGVTLDTDKWLSLAKRAVHETNVEKREIINYLAERFDIIAGTYENGYDVVVNLGIAVKQFRKKQVEALRALVTRDEIMAVVIPMINVSSHKQRKQILKSLGVDVKSTSKKVLDKYKNDPLVGHILSYQDNYKKGTAFGEEFLDHINPVSGKIHTDYNQLRAATGRFGSEKPNLQNIISDEAYRNPFVASDGFKFAIVDYNQIELRILAQVSGEPLFVEAFKNNKDLHTLTASIIFDAPEEKISKAKRKVGKTVNFAVVYGSSEYGLYRNFNIPLDKGKDYLIKFFSTYNILDAFIKQAGSIILNKGYSITLFGRKRFFTMPREWRHWNWEDRKEMDRIRREGVNHIIQGSSADMIKLLIIKLFYDNPFGIDNFRTILTVHDEVVVEFREDMEDLALEFIHRCAKDAGEVFLTDVPEDHKVIVDSCWRKEERK